MGACCSSRDEKTVRKQEMNTSEPTKDNKDISLDPIMETNEEPDSFERGDRSKQSSVMQTQGQKEHMKLIPRETSMPDILDVDLKKPKK